MFRFRNGIFLPDCSLELCFKKFSGLHYCLSVLLNKSFSRFISHSKHRFYGLFAYRLFLKNLKPFTRDLLIIANTFVDVNGFFQKFSTFFLNVIFQTYVNHYCSFNLVLSLRYVATISILKIVLSRTAIVVYISLKNNV